MHINTAALLQSGINPVENERTIHSILNDSYFINPKQTIQVLLYLRDKNNWAWQRDFVRSCLLWIKENHEIHFNRIIIDFILIGRWDDMFFCKWIINEHTIDIIREHLNGNNTLLKKWLPREKSNPLLARFIAGKLNLTMKEYRWVIKTSSTWFINTLYRPISSYYVNI